MCRRHEALHVLARRRLEMRPAGPAIIVRSNKASYFFSTALALKIPARSLSKFLGPKHLLGVWDCLPPFTQWHYMC
eukprot:2280635-Pleurochrysis_carterae.AAC.1